MPAIKPIEMTFPNIQIAGENSLIIYFSAQASVSTAAQIQAVQADLKQKLAGVLIDLVPSFNSLLVIYQALQTDHFKVKQHIQTSLQNAQQTQHTLSSGKQVVLPVYYDISVGPDLARIAEHAELSIDEVIKLHCQPSYLVYTIGFAPGFAYLGEVDQQIAMPRLATPRKAVPKGAVAIADRQTAVYPATSPGGWNLIGSCPITLFDLTQNPTMPFAMGDTVKFEPISKAEFVSLGGQLWARSTPALK